MSWVRITYILVSDRYTKDGAGRCGEVVRLRPSLRVVDLRWLARRAALGFAGVVYREVDAGEGFWHRTKLATWGEAGR